MRLWVKTRVRGGHHYPLYEACNDVELFIRAWHDQILAMQRVADVYASGAPPPSPDIDAPRYDVASKQYGMVVSTIAYNVLEEEVRPLFFEPAVTFAVYLLEANGRDEAGRFVGIDSNENGPTLQQFAHIKWDSFPFAAILVPGEGPDVPQVGLSPGGRARLRFAVKRFRERKAPLIIVSGGFVHPSQTPYCEALEMKRALVEDYGVPANAILIEPYARHTTTNLRNATRLLLAAGWSAGKPLLITTDTYQAADIRDARFAERCRKTLGYVPFVKVEEISPLDLAMRVTIESLQVDWRDPLDP